jgi:hypothetical protein
MEARSSVKVVGGDSKTGMRRYLSVEDVNGRLMEDNGGRRCMRTVEPGSMLVVLKNRKEVYEQVYDCEV